MTTDLHLAHSRTSQRGLPELAKTRSGAQFRPRKDIWKYRDDVNTVSLDFAGLPIANLIRRELKRVLLWYAEHRSPSHLKNLFERFRHFVSHISIADEITAADLMNYRTALPKKRKWYLSPLAGLLIRWHSMGLKGVREDAFLFLSGTRFKGNRKGEAVLTMDPHLGRFSDVDLAALQAALGVALEDALITLDEYILGELFLAIGPRPVQFAAMKICDFSVVKSREGVITYVLSVPRAKQREPMFRSSFTDRVLIAAFGQRLVEYTALIREQFTGVLADPEQAPMFPFRHNHSQSPGFKYHGTGGLLGLSFKNAMSKLSVVSERTGKPLNVAPIRCRRTIGCRAAEEGHSILVIAGLLDHKDTQNAGVYIEASPEIMERVDRAVAFRLAPLAQAFSGTLIANESQARRAGDHSSRVSDPRFDIVGNCGKYGFCGALAPIACYTCRAFQPWLDGPHQAVLDFLIKERDTLAEQTDLRIASINDRTIWAVAQVVLLCRQTKSNDAGRHDGE